MDCLRFSRSQELRLSGSASACGLAIQTGAIGAIGMNGIGAIEVSVTNPAGGYDATDVSVDLFLGPPQVQPSRFSNYRDTRRWASIPDGSTVSGTFGGLDGSEAFGGVDGSEQVAYVAVLIWHDPSGIAFAADFVDIIVPTCDAAPTGGGTGGLPPTR